jgi:putative ABC transport system permease protein
MGAANSRLLLMIVLQAVVVGAIGYGLGVGAASLFGAVTQNSEVAFRLPWQILALTAGAVLLICAGSALASIWKVIRLEPAIVFRS